MSKQVSNLSSLLDVLQEKVEQDSANGGVKSISMAQVLALIGRRAYGPLLLIIGLISISPLTMIPGSTWAFATLTLAIAAQMALHKERPWMPKAVLKLQLSESMLEKFVRRARPTARVVDSIIKPRLQFLADPPWVLGVAIATALAALATYPLGLIPIAPLAPGLAITFFGLGLTARDGLMLLLGGLAMAGGAWLLTHLFIG